MLVSEISSVQLLTMWGLYNVPSYKKGALQKKFGYAKACS